MLGKCLNLALRDVWPDLSVAGVGVCFASLVSGCTLLGMFALGSAVRPSQPHELHVPLTHSVPPRTFNLAQSSQEYVSDSLAYGHEPSREPSHSSTSPRLYRSLGKRSSPLPFSAISRRRNQLQNDSGGPSNMDDDSDGRSLVHISWFTRLTGGVASLQIRCTI